MTAKFENAQITMPRDPSDPGFSIPGHTLRWISSRVSELTAGRPWRVLRKSDLPESVIRHIEDMNPAAFEKGDTVRRGHELVLAYSTIEARQNYRAKLDEMARDEASALRTGRDDPENMESRFESEDVHIEMPKKAKRGIKNFD